MWYLILVSYPYENINIAVAGIVMQSNESTAYAGVIIIQKRRKQIGHLLWPLLLTWINFHYSMDK